MELKNMKCPDCDKEMDNNSNNNTINKPALKFDDCLRKCNNCMVGYSNAQESPTLIYKDYKKNIPKICRPMLEDVLEEAINKVNLKNKKKRIGYGTSEDAVTWTIFRLFQIENWIPSLIKYITDSETEGDHLIYYWGVPLKNNNIEKESLQKLCDVLKGEFKEEPNSLTEPDIIIEDDKTVIFFEIKFNSNNTGSVKGKKYEKYWKAGKEYFECSETEFKNLPYQLVRNWSVGNAYAKRKDKDFIFINLDFKKNESEEFRKLQDSVVKKDNCKFMNGGQILNLEGIELPDEIKRWLEKRKINLKN